MSTITRTEFLQTFRTGINLNAPNLARNIDATALARLQALGSPMPQPVSTFAWSGDLNTVAEHLSEIERRFSDYEARFALN